MEFACKGKGGKGIMLNKISYSKNKVVGIKQTCKAIKEGRAKAVFLAEDADLYLLEEVKELCEKNHLETFYVKTMKKLGKACNIDVKAACAALLIDD